MGGNIHNKGPYREGAAHLNACEAARNSNKEIFQQEKRARFKIIRQLGVKKGDTVILLDGSRTLVCSIRDKDGLINLFSKGKVEPAWLRDNLEDIEKLHS